MSDIIGYTTIEQPYTSSNLSGLELAKRDLLNHFHIRKGEKWTDPTFGCDLPLYVFQPLDDITTDAIKEEVFNVLISCVRIYGDPDLIKKEMLNDETS